MIHSLFSLVLPLARYSSPGKAAFCGALTAITFGVIFYIADAIKKRRNKDNDDNK